MHTKVRAQQVPSEMEAAEPQGFPFPSLVLCIQSLQQCWRTAAHLVPDSKKRCSSASTPAQGTEASLGQPYASTKTATDALMALDVGRGTSPASPAHAICKTELCHKPHSPKSSHRQEMPTQPCKPSQHFWQHCIFLPGKWQTWLSPTHNSSSITGCTELM